MGIFYNSMVKKGREEVKKERKRKKKGDKNTRDAAIKNDNKVWIPPLVE
jgi:hypothetical protein